IIIIIIFTYFQISLSSGSLKGKTTILRLVIGLLQRSSGNIRVFGEMPNSKESLIPGPNVGYMSQETALYPLLTVRETLLYFAKINCYNGNIQKRMDHLIELLQIERKNQLVCTLSGGQKRRTSLAVALFHEPPFLILDEPTVGVDPILRKQIWDYLRGCIDKGQTIIITTHYINEATYANCVGFLRNKRLLIESNPQ